MSICGGRFYFYSINQQMYYFFISILLNYDIIIADGKNYVVVRQRNVVLEATHKHNQRTWGQPLPPMVQKDIL